MVSLRSLHAGPVIFGLFLGATVAGVPAASAFELFGVQFFGNAEPEELSADAQRYEIDFVVAGDEELADELKAASQLHSKQDEIPLSPASLIARARGDYSRLLAVLYSEGRYGPSISISIDGRSADSIPADARFGPTARVQVTVDPGPVFVFGDVAVAGAPGPVPGDDTVPETPEEIGLVPGNVARSPIVLGSEAALVGRWRELGHPKARIAERRAVARHDRGTLDVGIDVAPGPAAVYGGVQVTGTERMDPAFVARQTGLQPGEPFDPDDLELARKQLRRLRVFQAIRIVEGDEVLPDGTLPMTVQVAERPLRVYGFGADYSTLDGAGVEAYWQHRNLFGQAERLRFEGRVSRIASNSFDDLEYYAGVVFLKPGVITPFTDLTAKVFAEQERPESYLARRAAAQLGLAHRFSDTLEGAAKLNLERSRTEDALGKRDFLIASVPAELTYDSRNDELDPKKGIHANLAVEPLHEFEYGNTAVIVDLRAATYVAIDPDERFVVAGRLGMGSLSGAPRDEMPADRLFFAGGGGSIRGYAYRNVGPRLATGEVVGGRSYVDGSIELRGKATEQFGFAAFVDAGNAFEETFPDFSEELRVGVGAGLRYYTGFGPLRLDVAVPLDPEAGDPDFAIYVGLGQAF